MINANKTFHHFCFAFEIRLLSRLVGGFQSTGFLYGSLFDFKHFALLVLSLSFRLNTIFQLHENHPVHSTIGEFNYDYSV